MKATNEEKEKPAKGKAFQCNRFITANCTNDRQHYSKLEMSFNQTKNLNIKHPIDNCDRRFE